jgi:hypothetical protein
VSPWAEVLRDLSYGTLDRLRLDLVAEQERRGARFDAGDVPRVHSPTADRPFRMVPVRCTAQEGHVSEDCWCREAGRAESLKLRDVIRACRDEAALGLSVIDGPYRPLSDGVSEPASYLSRILAACRAAVGAS